LYANPEKTASFRYDRDPVSDEPREGIMGAEVCAWEYGNPQNTHYELSFAPSAILLLDKMWNGADATYNKEYRRALTKLLLGIGTPQGYDVFELFGSMMPPRENGKNTYAEIASELIDVDSVRRHVETLKSIEKSYSSIYLKRLTETFCITDASQWMMTATF
jgi:hypothetical protein